MPARSPWLILGNAGWLTGTRMAGDVLSFGLFVVLSRHFGPDGIGQFAYGFAIASFVAISVTLGLGDFGIREFARIPAKAARRLLAQLVATQLVLAVVASIGLAIFLIATRASATVAGIISLLSAQQAFLSIARTLFAPAYARQSMVSPAMIELGCRAAGMIVTLVLVVVFDTSLMLALVGYPLGGLAVLGLAMTSGVRELGRMSLRGAHSGMLTLVRTAWPFGASEMVYLFYTRASLVILGGIGGDAAAGIYASSLKFYEVSALPVSLLGFAAFPMLSRLFEDRAPAIAQAAGRLFLGALMIAGLVAWGMVFVVPAALVPLMGDKFSVAAPVVRIMAVLVVLTAVEVTAIRVLLSVHLQVLQFKVQLASTVLNVVLALLLIPSFGVMGAIVATAAALLMADVLYLRGLHGRLATGPILAALRVFLLPLLAALASGVVAVSMDSPEWLVAVGSLGVFVAVALLSGAGTVVREQMRGQALDASPAVVDAMSMK